MKPGRELDALVAEKVMGMSVYGSKGEWLKPPRDPLSPVTGTLMNLPHYSSNIAAAWEVVEHLQNKGISFSLLWDAHKSNKLFNISNYHNGLPCRGWKNKEEFEIIEDTAPMAICLAALKAVGVEIGS